MSVIEEKRNVCANLVRTSNRIMNEVRCSTSESPSHRYIKEQICQELERQGKKYITEAIFIKGGRADILVLDDFLAIEIACSESEESLTRKAELYPNGIRIKVIRC